MIDEIDRSLERWIRAAMPLPAGAGEVSFDRPDRDWDARRTVPMIDLYLYSLTRSGTRSTSASTRVVQTPDGSFVRERPSAVIEARYLVSVWGGSAGVEHDVLGRLVNLLVDTIELPDEHLTERLRVLDPGPTLSIATDPVTSAASLWSGLEIPPRPCVQLVVYSPLAGPLVRPAADPPSSIELGVSRTFDSAAFAPRRRVLSRPGGGDAQRRATVSVQDSGRRGPTGDGRIVLEVPGADESGAPDG